MQWLSGGRGDRSVAAAHEHASRARADDVADGRGNRLRLDGVHLERAARFHLLAGFLGGPRLHVQDHGDAHGQVNRRRRKTRSPKRAQMRRRRAGRETVAFRSNFPQPCRRPLNAAAKERTTTQYITCR